MKRLLAAPLALILSVSAFAHNGMDHVMGTVASITSTSISVKTGPESIKTVMTDSKTMYMRGKAMITAKDIHAGERVVIHAKKVDGKLLAAEVEVGSVTTEHNH